MELGDNIMYLFIVSLVGVIAVSVVASSVSAGQETVSVVNESLSSYSISADLLSASTVYSPVHSVSRVYNSTVNLTADKFSFSSSGVQIVLS